jgi:hypothetical protein
MEQCSEMSALKIQTRGITQKKEYNIDNARRNQEFLIMVCFILNLDELIDRFPWRRRFGPLK